VEQSGSRVVIEECTIAFWMYFRSAMTVEIYAQLFDSELIHVSDAGAAYPNQPRLQHRRGRPGDLGAARSLARAAHQGAERHHGCAPSAPVRHYRCAPTANNRHNPSLSSHGDFSGTRSFGATEFPTRGSNVVVGIAAWDKHGLGQPYTRRPRNGGTTAGLRHHPRLVRKQDSRSCR
jgi:hypothetical protein